MRAVSQKLHSRRGASAVIALLFFVVVMTLGTLVLTAAVNNAGRLARNKDEQQRALAVRSAADFLLEDLKGMTYSASFQETKWVTYHEETSQDAEGNDVTYSVAEAPVYTYNQDYARALDQVSLTNLIKDLCENVYRRTTLKPRGGYLYESRPSDSDLSKDIQITASGDADNLLKVNAKFQITDTYLLTVYLTDNQGSNPVTLTFPATSYQTSMPDGFDSGNPEKTYTKYTTTVTWQPGTAEKTA